MDTRQIIRILEDIGLMLELKGESPFKSNAYHNAARSLHGLSGNIENLVVTGKIREVPGIGQALSEKLAELVGTGRLSYYDELKQSVPAGLMEMTAIPGFGPKKIRSVWEKLGITTVGELEYACIENRLANLSGFGQKTQEKVRQGILQLKKRRGYHLYANVIEEAESCLAWLKSSSQIGQVELVGAFRRRMEIIRTMDFLVGKTDPPSLLKALAASGEMTAAEVQGDQITATSSSGLPITLTLCEEITGSRLLAATGSPEHLTALAARAAGRGVSWDLTHDGSSSLSRQHSEADLYALLELPFIEPELREGWGEIEAADTGRHGRLVQTEDIQGIFHNHTNYSDGSASLEDMVESAKALGYRYIGISDHSQSAFYANGLKEDRIREQHAAIDALRKRITGIDIWKGIEADILVEGEMDYPDEVLARFDFVIASVHSRFNLSEEEQTARVTRALSNPYVTMLGHPTGRLLLSREGYRIDMKRVIDAAKEWGKVVEVNANPHRLDLDWRLCRYAKERGVQVSINPDAHATDGLEDVPFGVNMARKGGLEPCDVVNTKTSEDIVSILSCQKT